MMMSPGAAGAALTPSNSPTGHTTVQSADGSVELNPMPQSVMTPPGWLGIAVTPANKPAGPIGPQLAFVATEYLPGHT